MTAPRPRVYGLSVTQTTTEEDGYEMASKTYFYAGYSQGFHHRSDTESGALAHMAHNEEAHGARGRFVVKVTGSYFPARANDKRGTLARFLLANEVTAAAGSTVPAWVADRTAAAVPATVPATGVLVPAGVILLDTLATLANRSHLRPCGDVPAAAALVTLASLASPAVADVAAPAGSADVADAIAPAAAVVADAGEDDETPDEARRRRIEERAAVRRLRASVGRP